MTKSDFQNSSFLPIVLVAGILSGTLWRPASAPEGGRSGESPAGTDRVDVTAPAAPWVSDLRPAMDSIAAALGVDATDLDSPTLPPESRVLTTAAGARQVEARDELRNRLRTGVDGDGGFLCIDAAPRIAEAAEAVGASLLVDDDKDRDRAASANALLNEYGDWRLLVNLANRVRNDHTGTPRYDVNFIVATVPDYVDSNIGWTADQSLAAIQSGLTSKEYLFDRVKLIDWSRTAGSATSASSSRLHEEQPGVMIFRQVDNDVIRVQIVLLVLETPTAGVHQTAFRNSLRFVRAWNTCSGVGTRTLRVLGPTFSGSIVSLASVLAKPEIVRWFSTRLVITGSANADGNVQQMKLFSSGAIYGATVQPTSLLMRQIADFLGSMNAGWKDGERVALLIESNTTYGAEAGAAAPLGKAAVFKFPLHVAQLRSDAPALSQPGAALFPSAVVPLNMRELSPPTDLIPALRPQMTSPVVEATVNSILDAIRHQGFTAVGIFATDDRDVLFLSREVKRAAPDVQLFLFGTHALYLHPDYVPYLRGALVASSYSLSLANQPEVVAAELTGRSPRVGQERAPENESREPFQSMSAEGIAYATRALLSERLNDTSRTESRGTEVPYCTDPGSMPVCVPQAPVSINVIGEDGYWIVAHAQSSGTQVPSPGPLNPYPLPPLPGRIAIAAGLVGVFVAAHVLVLYLIQRNNRRERSGRRSFLELPFVRVLAPPHTVKEASGYHRVALMICFALLALVAAWVAAIILPFALSSGAAPWLVPSFSVLLVAGVFASAMKLYNPLTPLDKSTEQNKPRAEGTQRHRLRTLLRLPSLTGWLLFAGIVVTMGLFATVTVGLVRQGTSADQSAVVLARLVGGGIVSPAALTVSLMAAIYIVVITGVRRLSLIGYGYTKLSDNSKAFALLTGTHTVETDEQGEPPPFGKLLDMPAYNLPPIYPLVILLALAIAGVGMWHVSTIEGRVFSWFVRIGSLTALGAGLLLLAQGLATWNTARSHLKRLARCPVEPHFSEIASHVPWEISLAPPRLTELMPVARMADDVTSGFRELSLSDSAFARDIRRQWNSPRLGTDVEGRTGAQNDDMAELEPLFVASYVKSLHTEMAERQHAALIQSQSWFGLWGLANAIVSLMERMYWPPMTLEGTPRASRPTAVAEAATAAVASVMHGGSARRLSELLMAALGEAERDTVKPDMADTAERTAWFRRCEQLVALQMAFVLRDVVARTLTCLFGAMVCLTLLTSSHLFYSFNGRALLLTIDLLAVAGAAVVAVWILVDMERDRVLSRLRSTTPGRVDINWDFMRRIAVYGVLPLLVVIASLFPEIGGALFGWLEPLRKLSSL